MSSEAQATINLIKHSLEILVKDLQRPPARPTQRQRVESVQSLLASLERQLKGEIDAD